MIKNLKSKTSILNILSSSLLSDSSLSYYLAIFIQRYVYIHIFYLFESFLFFYFLLSFTTSTITMKR